MKLNLTVACLVATSAVYFVPLKAAAADVAVAAAVSTAEATVQLEAVDIKPAAVVAPAPLSVSAGACVNEARDGVVAQAEALNERIKPIKEIVGYVRSPQGFAIKMVNDHVMKIPAWVGYAIDPLGSLKNKAMDQVKTSARVAMGLDHKGAKNCSAVPGPDLSTTSADVTPADGDLNTKLIPIEANI